MSIHTKEPRLVIVDGLWKINLDNRLHAMIREVSKRKRQHISEPYLDALSDYLEIERIPKQVEKIRRNSIRIPVSKEFKEKVSALRKIAVKKQQSLAVVVEEALKLYLEKPENYLGKNFYERNKRRIEVIK